MTMQPAFFAAGKAMALVELNKPADVSLRDAPRMSPRVAQRIAQRGRDFSDLPDVENIEASAFPFLAGCAAAQRAADRGLVEFDTKYFVGASVANARLIKAISNRFFSSDKIAIEQTDQIGERAKTFIGSRWDLIARLAKEISKRRRLTDEQVRAFI
jgi:hypothetical protein